MLPHESHPPFTRCVIIEAITGENKYRLQAKADNYHRLGGLQGRQIPRGEAFFESSTI
jgi:hypothetical protein